jgi:hypothetical protein
MAQAQVALRLGRASREDPELRKQPSGLAVRPRQHDQSLTPEQRSLRARLGARAMHARHDAHQTTASGRAAFLARFEREVDPDGVLSPAERQRRAAHALSAHMSRLALTSSKARRARKGGGRATP